MRRPALISGGSSDDPFYPVPDDVSHDLIRERIDDREPNGSLRQLEPCEPVACCVDNL